jgi:PAS domain S-box-containing protein
MPHLNGTEASKDIRALILEDNRADAELMENELKNNGIVFRSKIVEDRKSYIKAIREFRPDIILSDYDLPAFSGAEALTLKKKLSPETPFILVTGAVGEERAIQMLTGGATDYVLKRNLSRLLPAVTRALDESHEHRKRKEAEAERDTLIKELESRVQERAQALQTEIEERKRTEEALREREMELAEAQRVSKIGGWIIDTATDRFKWSDELYRVFETDRMEIGDQFESFLNRVYPEDLHLVQKANAEIRASGEPFEFECRIITPRGAIKTIRIIGYASKDAKGKVVRMFGTVQDITELKQAERGLRESETRFRALVSATSEFLFRASPDASEIIEIYGHNFLKDIKIPSRTWFDDFIYTDDKPLVLAALKEAIRKKSLFEVENRVWLADGSVGWAFSRAVPILDDQNEILEWFGAVSDTTVRKRAEEALEESEERYRLIFVTSLNGILFLRPDGSIISANPSAQKMLEMTEEEFIQAGREGISDLSDPRLRSALEERSRTGKFRGELNLKTKDGRIFPVEASAVMFKDKKGQVFSSFVFQDITWRKEAERKLKESEQRFREMADMLPQLVWTATPEGGIDFFNSRYQEFPDIQKGKSGIWEWQNVIHPDDLAAALDKWNSAIQSGTDTQVEHRMRHRNGEYRWKLTRAVSIRDEKGKVLKWFGTTTDIHDMKVAESELIERTKQLEEANKELESFSYSVSHDLRAPLRAVNGFSRMLLDEGERLDDETNRKIQVIRENVLKMDRLIRDLLYFSRSGRAQISRAIIDMDRLVNEIWKEQLSNNPSRNMELRKGDLPPAFGDEAMIRQVLTNIISNAVKFSSRKKKSVIEVGAESDTKENIYCVKDNGAGFDMKYYGKLFGVFQRLHSEREYEGTGVGLAIVQRIVHRHGGRVWAEGKVGKGATFYFSLPNK